jgi:putative phosphonate metabolism protein
MPEVLDPRFAIYFTPAPGSALARFGAGVLGYNCDTGEDVVQWVLPGIAPADVAAATSEPRQYGFHATLAAPFRLSADRSEADLAVALETFARTQASARLGVLDVGLIGGFVALMPSTPDCKAFAADCVRAFHAFRAPLTAADRARRVPARLTPRQAEYLDRWGYPYVFDEFRFHMTLTGPLPAEQRGPWQAALKKLFAAQAAGPALIDAVSLMRQDEGGARFRVIRRASLQG